MCGRYVSPSERAIEDYWHIGARDSGRWIQSFNVAPTTQVPLLRLDRQGELELIPARWGLIPSWWKEEKPPLHAVFARSEEAASKPLWRQGLRSQRCLMPAQGWYEWNPQEQVRSARGRLVHQPYYLYSPNDPMLAIAAIWASWTGPDGQEVISCALLTRDAAPSISAIHNRMPVILPQEQFSPWLSPGTKEEQVHQAIGQARGDFTGHAVSTRVNSAQNDDEQLIEAIAEPES
ncbi:SOS response-associated peptidase [Pseudomonas sp. DY-1]|jgi:putative SOS response-associated peptidase YedK|uniref:SOS response-associated peptidase n=1 Tax=Pseudomonas sp. DY-1 TaxID=1755504 RepID=UPI000EA9A7D3|nr:SOS response-associated peptidase [Pseudomonas sp. DY-1]AYF90554.1 SOS response-associated peptidase [Pseudomonas sp. DY-1]